MAQKKVIAAPMTALSRKIGKNFKQGGMVGKPKLSMKKGGGKKGC